MAAAWFTVIGLLIVLPRVEGWWARRRRPPAALSGREVHELLRQRFQDSTLTSRSATARSLPAQTGAF